MAQGMARVSVNSLRLKKNIGAIQSKPDAALTLLQRKLFNICLFHAYKHLVTRDEHCIQIDLLHRYLGYQGNNWSKIEKAFQGLQSTLVCWNVFDQASDASEHESWTRVQYLGSVSWRKESREFAYTFNRELAKKLYKPGRYAVICLEIQKKFKSEHALVLYEQCVRYKTNVNGSRWFSIDELKDVLAIDRKAYPQFKQFNNRVIKPAINEINAVTDIHVDVELKRTGRQVSQIKFFICAKKLEVTVEDENQQKVVRELQKYRINETVIQKLLLQYDSHHIERSLQHMQSSSIYLKGLVKNPAGYLLKIMAGLKDDRALPMAFEHDDYHEKAVCIIERCTQSYRQLHHAQIEAFIENLSHEDREAFNRAFTLHMEKNMNLMWKTMLRKYGKDGVLESSAMRAHLRHFALSAIPALQESLLTFEAYISQQAEGVRTAWQFLQTAPATQI